MDYFDSNFNDDRADQYADLPEDYGWQDMKGGIYDKMSNSKGTTKNRWLPFLLLLLIGGCGTGTWFVSNYMGSSKKHTNQNIKEDHIRQDASSEKNTIIPENETSNKHANTIRLDELPLSKKVQKKENLVVQKSDANNINTSYSNQLKNQKPVSTELKDQTFLSSPDKNLLTPVVTENKDYLTIKSLGIEWSTSELIATLPVKLLDVKSNFDDFILAFHVSENGKEKEIQQSQKEIVFGISGGIVNWEAFDANNTNHDYNSGYPGFTISPSLSLNFNQKHALQIDYEYSQFEELFDYQGTQDIEVFKQNAKVIEIRSSLTGNLIEEHHEDALLSGTRYFNEVKYNDFNIHTFSLGYRNDQIKWSKSSLSFYTGASYLFSINQKGKRLNEEQELIEFDNTNPIFRSKQLGLKFALQYNYKLNDKIDFVSKMISTKYFTNWEVSNSNTSSKPLIYSLNIGLNYRLLR